MKKLFSLLIILALQAMVFAQRIEVTGIIKNESGNPIKGVTIQLKGTHRDTLSDSQGRFAIKVDSLTQVLIISGYDWQTQNVELRGRKKLEIIMKWVGTDWYCFVAGTKICLPGGNFKNIESIKAGDAIMSFDAITGLAVDNFVTEIDSVVHKNLIILKYNDSSEVTCTTDHPFYVSGKGWCSIDPELTFRKYGIRPAPLMMGDTCIKLTGMKLSEIRLVSATGVPRERMTYNLTGLQKQRNYFANGILVSNEFFGGEAIIQEFNMNFIEQ